MQVDNYKEAQLYTGNGITTQFDFYFSFGATAEIKVFVAGEELASNQYSVSSVNYQSGGTVICLVAPILNAAIRIERQTPFTQESAFSNFNQVDLKKLETSLDKMVRIEQELRNAIDTSAESNFQNQIDAISDVLTEVSEFTQDIDDDLQEHKENTENPHSVTKTQVGLGNVDNTSDVNKPVSTATQTALNAKANLSGATFTDAISATNLSGTNTGDETKETIIEKLDGEFEPKITYPTESLETKYYRGDGTFQEIAIGGGGYAANLYFTTTDSDVSGYKKISYELPATETELPATFSGTQLLRTYLFDAGIDTTLIDAGLWSANFSSKLNSSGGVTYLRGEVFLRHIDNTETTLFSATSPELNNTLEFLVIRIESNQPSFACVATDRLGMRVYGVTNRDPNVTLTTIIGDGRASYFNTPLKLRHSQLRDLNSDSENKHVSQTEIDAWNASVGGSSILPAGTCSTAGATAAKEVSVSGYTETAGACVLITFANKNTVAGALTLNINSGGAKSILHADGTAVSATNPAYFIANCPIQFCYDGTGYRFKQERVNSYVNGANWYNLYNNGWVEQGGFGNATSNFTNTSLQVNLLIPMLSSNYYAQARAIERATYFGDDWFVTGTRSTTSFNTSASTGSFQWEVKGFKA